ncbi:MAG: hypothetical protein EBY39_04380 [Flavobacteriia bacterium]|nr:hypothetical protein [Flavobacteriia bacterium]
MLDKDFWNNRYKTAQTGWDIGYPSTPLKTFIDTIEDKDTNILIPGCTFFCAIEPNLRKGYVQHTSDLLNKNGKIVGLLFAEEFGNDHPPFGGTKEEYLKIFSSHYDVEYMQIADNSIESRKGRELFISLKKQDCLT